MQNGGLAPTWCSWIRSCDGRWTVSAIGVGRARCPGCVVGSTKRHGWQVRHLQDLPALGRPITLRVRYLRWRCQNAMCERQTFTDRLAKIAHHSARRTTRGSRSEQAFGHAAGSRPAERPDG
jgi:transposase